MKFNLLRIEEKDILKDSRSELGLTQQQVSDKAGIQLRQYQRFESGERQLSSSSFNIACKVLRALELDIVKFNNGEYCISDDTVELPVV